MTFSSPLLFTIAALIWGSTFWAITLQLGDVAPAVSVVYRFGLASATLFGICFFRGDRLRLSWAAQRWLILQGLASFGLSYACTYGSEQYLVSAMVAVLFSLMVIWSPIAERILFGTPLTLRIWWAATLAVSGVVLLFLRAIRAAWDLAPGIGNAHFWLGLGLALTATLSSTAGNLLLVKVRKHANNLFLTMAWAMLWGTLGVALWVTVSGQHWQLPPTATYWFSLSYLALFGSVIAFAAYFILIDRIGPQKAVYVGVVTPVISVLLSIQFEHYRPGPNEWLGMILCLAGVAWALKGDAPPAVIPTLLPHNQEL
jgi:drug/metabolite transporter (DMT)-like permease